MTGIVSYAFIDRDGKFLASKDEEILLTPASNMKIVSGYSAYNILGGDFNFKTRFNIEGNELFVGGDPTPLLDGPTLIKIGKKILEKKIDIKHITVNNSALDDDFYARGWMMDDNSYSYQTKIASLSVNEGCVPQQSNMVDLRSLANIHEKYSLPVEDQTQFFINCLWKALNQNVKGEFGLDNVIKLSKGDLFIQPLKDIIRHIETFSCNFSAEVITKYLSYFKRDVSGNWKDSTELITTFLGKLGYGEDQFRIIDGSGLSRLNLLSTNLLGTLINKIENAGHSEFLDLLPSPGSGTLKNRLLEFKDLGIHAKTGSVSYCSSLTGYIRKLGISFSIIINNSIDKPEELTRSVDKILSGFLSRFS